MSEEKKSVPTECESTTSQKEKTKGSSRRQFLSQVGVAAGLAAGTLAAPAVTAASQGNTSNSSGGSTPPTSANGRVLEAFELRVAEATRDAALGAAKNVNNGDQALYADHGGTYTKALAHDAYGRVTAASFASFETALNTGKFSAFQEIIVGGTKTLNCPQAAYAFNLAGPDGAQFGQPQVPPAPPIAGAVSGTELLEHYWAALLNDVNFTDYDSNPLAQAAAAELGSQPSYLGPRTSSGQVTPDLLFRGNFPGETQGPYTSQFFIQPTYFGAQQISQLQKTFVPGVEYGTNFTEWLQIQNGQPTGRTLAFDPTPRYRRNGRDFAAYTHVDVLYQAYLTAYLVLAGIGAPLNPGQSVCWLDDGKWFRHVRRTGFCVVDRGCRLEGAQCGVVPEVAGAPASAAGSDGGTSAAGKDRAKRVYGRDSQRYDSEFRGAADEFQYVRVVAAAAWRFRKGRRHTSRIPRGMVRWAGRVLRSSNSSTMAANCSNRCWRTQERTSWFPAKTESRCCRTPERTRES